MGELIVLGVPGAAIIVALVELAKRYGLASRWSVLLAVGLGIGLAVVLQLAEIHPQVAVWAQVVLGGVILGLSASGLYSGGKAITSK
ncbi:MAG: hypothetical protein LLG44_12875 [Chloroflexi bacterium]|nr:hypothetical protein [Chloroflexota bacterium]